ncbi:lipase maturation factor 2-like [Hetaerina americana]|uniref:lipase maturation factor 2-like n=1 Tax=Hetaerina americana TaxID=62018 RepID=UPI003A7F217F
MVSIVYTRNLYLRGISVVYLFAFASLYVQIPGLYGNNGVLPARTQMESKANGVLAKFLTKPTLLWFAPYLGLDTEYMMDVLAIVGIAIAFLGMVSQKFCNAMTFTLMWVLYYSLYQVGQTFMWFQWDILLLEAGFISIFVAPLVYVKPGRNRSQLYQNPVTFQLVRWLLFRLMFSSGVLKFTSGCPVWWGMKALSVHFESQCIPTPVAWYSHHLPEWFLKLAMIWSLVTEVAVPFLFFFPLSAVRVTAFYLQILLQLSIIITGNYNFFNLLTMVLCISLLNDNFFFTKRKGKGRSSESSWFLTILAKIVHLGVYAVLIYFVKVLFSLRITDKYTIESDTTFTREEFDRALGKAVPAAMLLGALPLALASAEAVTATILDGPSRFFSRIANFFSTLFYVGVAVFLFSISLIPLASIHPPVLQSSANSTVPMLLRHWHSRVEPFQISNPYGLFRRMTGVGGRPEVVIEGSYVIDGPWKEYHFLYKPGDVNSSLPFVAPHQPRLDWQMWFAALQTYNQNPWIVSLAYRLLNGQPEVLQLIDTTRNPFSKAPPRFIRATLYHYHYTSWSQKSSPSWWWREKIGEYFPIFAKDHSPLLEYLKKLKIIGQDTQSSAGGRGKGKDRKKDLWTNTWLISFLQFLRSLACQVEASIFLWSLFTAGCLIAFTRRI